MKTRNEHQDGRFTLKTVHRKRGKTSARKGGRPARSKANTSESLAVSVPSESSVLVSVDGKSEKLTKDEQIHALKWGLNNSRLEIVQMIDLLAKVHAATVDVLRFYDRAVGNVIDDSGYSVADMRRLDEIRKLACPERSEG